MTAVTNSGPLIALAKLNRLRLLRALYGEVIVPEAVYVESVVAGQLRGYQDAAAIRAFLETVGWQPVAPLPVPPELANDVRLGRGELEAIVLARRDQALLLMDEVYARALAQRVGLPTVGTLGILLEGYRRGHLAPDVLEELLLTIERREDIWVDPELCRRARKRALGK